MKSLHLVKTSTGATWAFRVMRDLVQMGEDVHVAMPVDGILVQQYKVCWNCNPRAKLLDEECFFDHLVKSVKWWMK